MTTLTIGTADSSNRQATAYGRERAAPRAVPARFRRRRPDLACIALGIGVASRDIRVRVSRTLPDPTRTERQRLRIARRERNRLNRTQRPLTGATAEADNRSAITPRQCRLRHDAFSAWDALPAHGRIVLYKHPANAMPFAKIAAPSECGRRRVAKAAPIHLHGEYSASSNVTLIRGPARPDRCISGRCPLSSPRR